MNTFIEFHLIQSFAPSNLNRDDTGSPKDALFGGVRRARVSSQCLKRAIRLEAKNRELVPNNKLSLRTKDVPKVLFDRLSEAKRGDAAALDKIEVLLAALDLKLKKQNAAADGKTEYLVLISEGEVEALGKLIEDEWAALDIALLPDLRKSKTDSKNKAAKERNKAAKERLSSLHKRAGELLRTGKAVDLALFGRMLADLPEANYDASCQVAHAISTHRVDREFDYYTAVDDYSGAAETGAGMIGQTEFNSATFYRYAVLDVAKLYENLQKDRDLALAAVEAFTEAIARAIPTGKQNAFAAHNPPEFIGVAVRHASALNLANAFEKPVFAQGDLSLSAKSVEQLGIYEQRLSSVYGSEKDCWLYLDLTGKWPTDRGTAQPSLKTMSESVRQLAATILAGGTV